MAYAATYDPYADLGSALMPRGYNGITASGDVYMPSTRRGERGNDPGGAVNHGYGGTPPGQGVHGGRAARRAARAAGADPALAGTTQAAGADAGYPHNRRRQAVQRTLDELLSILGQHGQTDPGQLNNQLTDISRGAEAGQNNLDEYLASQGLGGSGVGIATHAAIGAAGESQRSHAIADENARAAERRRQDLMLTLQLILNPKLTRRGQNMALQAAKYGQHGADYLGAAGNILGGLGNVLGSGGSGGNSNDTLGGGSTGYGDYGGYDPNNDPGGAGGYGNGWV